MAEDLYQKIPEWSETGKRFAFPEGQIKSDIPATRIEDWRDFAKLLESPFFNRPNSELVFRGQRCSDWELTPSLARVCKNRLITQDVAEEQLSKFRSAVRGRLNDNSLVNDGEEDELWSIGQHHGLLTPLLDWTYSPYVALFFAFCNEDTEESNPYRAVYVLNKTFIENINDEQLRIVEPRKDNNGRLINQAGLFTHSPYGETIESRLSKISLGNSTPFPEQEAETLAKNICKIYIRNAAREECMLHLRRMNIHHSSLFPDLLGASEHCNILIAETTRQKRKEEKKAEAMEIAEARIYMAREKVEKARDNMEELRDEVDEVSNYYHILENDADYAWHIMEQLEAEIHIAEETARDAKVDMEHAEKMGNPRKITNAKTELANAEAQLAECKKEKAEAKVDIAKEAKVRGDYKKLKKATIEWKEAKVELAKAEKKILIYMEEGKEKEDATREAQIALAEAQETLAEAKREANEISFIEAEEAEHEAFETFIEAEEAKKEADEAFIEAEEAKKEAMEAQIEQDMEQDEIPWQKNEFAGKPLKPKALNESKETMESFAILQEKFDLVRGLFHGFDYTDFETEQSELILPAVDHLLNQENLINGKKLFLNAMSLLSKAYRLCDTMDEVQPLKQEIAFFEAVRAAIQEQNKDAQLLDNTANEPELKVTSDEIVTLTDPNEPKMDVLSEKFLRCVYQTLANNETADQKLGNDVLRQIALDITEKISKNITIDWQIRESVQAKLKNLIRHTLRHHKYSPEGVPKTVEQILKQAKECFE